MCQIGLKSEITGEKDFNIRGKEKEIDKVLLLQTKP